MPATGPSNISPTSTLAETNPLDQPVVTNKPIAQTVAGSYHRSEKGRISNTAAGKRAAGVQEVWRDVRTDTEPGDGHDETEYVYRGIDRNARRASFKVRIRGFTFAWFTVCMATAGLAILLGRIPDAYRCRGITVLGQIVFMIDLVAFFVIHGMLAIRFYHYPHAFKTMLKHPVESSYICAWLQACATILVATEIYGFQHAGFWLVKTCLVFWCIDWVLAVALSIYLPLVHFLDHPHAHKEMPPSFMLMPTVVIYTATVAYGLIPQLPVPTAIWVFWLSYILLGFGFFLFIFYLALWFQKLLSGGHYHDKHALTPFMIVGMTSYTAGGMFGLGSAAINLFPKYGEYAGQDYLPSTGTVNGTLVYGLAGSSFHMFNLAFGLMLYGFTWWCLLVSATMSIQVFYKRKASPSLSAMFSVAFPTTGIIVDTWEIARVLGSTGRPSGIRWLDILGLVMLGIWILGYFASITGVAFKISKRQLLWEGKDDNAPAFGFLGEFVEVSKRKGDDQDV